MSDPKAPKLTIVVTYDYNNNLIVNVSTKHVLDNPTQLINLLTDVCQKNL